MEISWKQVRRGSGEPQQLILEQKPHENWLEASRSSLARSEKAYETSKIGRNVSRKQVEASSLEVKRHTEQGKLAEMLAGGKQKQAR